MANVDEKGNWLDPQGRSVPRKFVPELDRRRDAMVEKIHAKAGRLAVALAAFDREARGLIEAHLEWAQKDAGVTLNEGGNYTFSSFSGDKRVSIKVTEFLTFDERLQLAKALIDEFLKDKSEGASDEIQVLIDDVFQVDKKGRINARRVLSLRKHKFKDERWRRAMELISDSVAVANARAYLMMHVRPAPDAEWRAVRLDLSATAAEVVR